MHIERIVYRLGSEMSFEWIKNRIDEVLSQYQTKDFSEDINNVLELQNILQYIDYFNRIQEPIPTEYNLHRSEINRILGVYFSKITNDNLTELATDLYFDYRLSFWENICRYKRIDVIEDESFAKCLEKNSYQISAILSRKEIVSKFSKVIYQHLLVNARNIDVVISYLLEKEDNSSKKLYILDFFTENELSNLFKVYIQSENPNPNTLTLIRISQNDFKIGLTDEIRLLAKRREKEIIDKLSENKALLEHGIGVSFRDVPEIKQFIKEDNLPVIIYDRKWIQNNQDYPTLLNNFIYLFEYTDLQFRSAFPDNKSNASVITDLFKVKGKKAYNPTTTFEIMRGLHSIQMQGYLDELQRINVNIEEIFKWFFEEYLLEEFQTSGFIYNVSSQGTTYLEKCKNIASEIDAILKQYRIFSKYGYIDRELFEMSSEHIVFSQIKSNQQKKYLYAKSDRIKSCVNYLFKDSQFCYVEDERIKKCKNLYVALDNFKTVPKDIFKWPLQQQNLKTLIDFGTVIEDNGMLRLNRKNAIVLYRLYERDVICYHYCEKFHDELEKLVLQGDLSEEDTLFSIPEQDYLNYILNKAAFSDGFDLRNKYIHGTNSKDEQINFQDYLEFLKIMVLIIIKINEEFCLKYPIQEKN